MTIVVFSPQRLKKMMGTNSLTQELKLEGTKCPMILVLRSIILEIANESLGLGNTLDLPFLII